MPGKWAICLGRVFLVASLPIGFSLPAHANTPTAQALLLDGIQKMDQAYNLWQAGAFQEAVEVFKRAEEAEPGNYLTDYWQGAALFYLASYYLHAREQDRNQHQGESTVDEGIRVLTRAIERNPAYSESFALRGVLRGMKIKLNTWAVFSHGPGVQSDRDQALNLNPDNPRVHYLTGVSLWMSPEIFGGGAKQALAHFLKAEELFEAEAGKKHPPLDPAWGYSTCLSFIGDVYAKQGEWQQAYRYYQKSLMANPQDQRAQEGLDRISRQGESSQEE
ncbi:MAG: tetratricopeptide repeat protein [candidate division FCPU426 bacterium]